MACIATWAFGMQAVSVASECLQRGENCIEALEKAVNSWVQSKNIFEAHVAHACLCNVCVLLMLYSRRRRSEYGEVLRRAWLLPKF